jgi:hypothetical protein
VVPLERCEQISSPHHPTARTSADWARARLVPCSIAARARVDATRALEAKAGGYLLLVLVAGIAIRRMLGILLERERLLSYVVSIVHWHYPHPPSVHLIRNVLRGGQISVITNLHR